MNLSEITPDHLVLAADFVVQELKPCIGRDWSVRAGKLDWDVDHTLTHMAAGPAKHTLYLASRSSRFLALRIDRLADASQTERLTAIGDVARALANVVASSPSGTRAFHSSGMLDPEGFTALGCHHLLIHGHDVAQGLGLPFSPPANLCGELVARLTPWMAGTGHSWESMLWHQNRIDLPGRPRNENESLVTIPLSEWDGTIPRRDERPVVEWMRDQQGRWQPTYIDLDSEDSSS